MPTLAVKTSKFRLGHQGLSLIEILVALLLISLMFTLIPSSENSRRHKDIQTAMDDLDRAVRFASNEATLRNSITRLRIDMEKNPMEYVVEYGPKGDLILPAVMPEDDLSIEEAKKLKEQKSKLDAQFKRVEEFADITREFSVEVQFVAVATTWQKGLQKSGQASTYFYPTGERDSALFFLTTQDELGVLEVEPFQDKTNATYLPYPVAQEGGPPVAKTEDIQETKIQDFYKDWLKQ